jgi:hypothetical protein
VTRQGCVDSRAAAHVTAASSRPTPSGFLASRFNYIETLRVWRADGSASTRAHSGCASGRAQAHNRLWEIDCAGRCAVQRPLPSSRAICTGHGAEQRAPHALADGLTADPHRADQRKRPDRPALGRHGLGILLAHVDAAARGADAGRLRGHPVSTAQSSFTPIDRRVFQSPIRRSPASPDVRWQSPSRTSRSRSEHRRVRRTCCSS